MSNKPQITLKVKENLPKSDDVVCLRWKLDGKDYATLDVWCDGKMEFTHVNGTKFIISGLVFPRILHMDFTPQGNDLLRVASGGTAVTIGST